MFVTFFSSPFTHDKLPHLVVNLCIKTTFSSLYRLDELGADTAEAKASHILKGLGFNKAMQEKKCKDFSGKFQYL